MVALSKINASARKVQDFKITGREPKYTTFSNGKNHLRHLL